MQIKRIGFIGGPNVGKDTLATDLFSFLKLKGRSCYYISETAEQGLMRRMNLKTVEGQLWMMGTQIAREMEAVEWGKRAFVICNRTVLDNYAYSRVYKLPEEQTVRAMMDSYIGKFPYDLILVLHPFANIVDDGVRIETREEQLAITDEMIRTAKYAEMFFHIPYVEIIEPSKKARRSEIHRAVRRLL